MLNRRALTAVATAAWATVATGLPGPGRAGAAEPASLADVLRPYLETHGLPALGAAVVREGAVVASGVVGLRRVGRSLPVSADDRVHIGSCGKAMTALLAGMLVEAGHLRWDSSLGELFPDLAATMQPAAKAVTLEQLLSHTSGMPEDNAAFIEIMTRSFAQDALNLDELRHWFVREWTALPLEAEPGSRFAYSNAGYTIAGAMLERAAQASWEELMVDRLFEPLGLRSAGFGPQATLGRTDAAVGHAVREDGSLKPILGGPGADNPAVVGPAGVVHLSVGDFATWAGWHAGAGRRGPRLVSPETLRRLHAKVIDMPPRPGAAPGTPSRGSYGLGWGFVSYPFASGPILQHGGSNTLNLAQIVVEPEKDFAFVLMTNVGGARATAAFRGLTETFYTTYSPS